MPESNERRAAEHAYVLDKAVYPVVICVSGRSLSKYVGGDEEAHQEQQGGRDEKLRRERGAVAVDLGAGGAAHRAAALDHRAGTVSADQVLAAHLKPLPVGAPAHLA